MTKDRNVQNVSERYASTCWSRNSLCWISILIASSFLLSSCMESEPTWVQYSHAAYVARDKNDVQAEVSAIESLLGELKRYKGKPPDAPYPLIARFIPMQDMDEEIEFKKQFMRSLDNLLDDDPHSAEDLLRRYLKVLTEYKQPLPDTQWTFERIADKYKWSGSFDDSQRVFEEFIAQDRKAHNEKALINHLMQLADMYNRKGDLKKAESVYLECLSIAERTKLSLVEVTNSLASLYRQMKKPEEEKKFSERYLALKRGSIPSLEDPKGALEMAKTYCNKERFSDAMPLYQKALAQAEQTTGKNSKLTAEVLEGMESCLFNHQHYAECEPILLRLLQIGEHRLATEKDITEQVIYSPNFDLAWYYETQNKFDLSEKYWKRTIEVQEKMYGKNSWLVYEPMKAYAEMLRKAGRVEESEKTMARALELKGKR
ncbi:MAG: tetratricopeptide repeat protein [Cyanobacteria bacterium]|nr:tetratricopeptide repeat protein [Cyanobacteriota bacterium]